MAEGKLQGSDTRKLQRHFVTVGERQVHYRRGGHGPSLLMLHSSPASSRALAPLADRLTEAFTVFALDTPGYGLSDPLNIEAPTIGDYADALAPTLDALGIGSALLYGAMTGSLIGLDFAHRYPSRVARAVFEGVPLFTEEQRAEFMERYAPVFEPTWDGSHLVALWSRFRDRFLFWPWYDRSVATRLDRGLPDARQLHEGVLDQLRAGVNYVVGYQAAFAYEAETAIAGITVPTTFVVRAGDQLAPDLDRIVLSPAATKEVLPPDLANAAARLLTVFKEAPLPANAPAVVTATPVPGIITRAFVATPYGQLHLRETAEVDGRPLVLLHASPTSAKFLEPLMLALSSSRPTIAFDTLGNGESDKAPFTDPWSGDYAEVVVAALDGMGIDEYDLYGSHTGATIAIEVAIARPAQVKHLILDGVPMFDPEETTDRLASHAPPLEIRGDGTHLMWAWTQAVQRSLFSHWYRPTREEIKNVEPPTPAAMHEWLLEILKSGDTYHVAYLTAFRYPTRDRLPLVEVPMLACAMPEDVLAPYSEEAASLARNGRAAALPDDLSQAAEVLHKFLTS
jgi:pimeloyl-ACP methyl ester carboxylesterase